MHQRRHHTVIHTPAFQPQDLLRFVQVDPFPGQWHRLGLDDEDLNALEVCIMVAPQMGSVVPGTHGLRKGRFTPPAAERGKRGAYRVFYVYFREYSLVVLLAIIAKNEQSNLSKAARNALAKVIERLEHLLEKGVIR